jgi:hypothetical protein
VLPDLEELADEIPLEMPSSRGVHQGTLADRLFGDQGEPGDAARRPAEALPLAEPPNFGSTAPESRGEGQANEEEDPFAKISELMMSSTPEPIPGVFASSPKPRARRRGGVGLVATLIVLLLVSAGLALYFLQDMVIDKWPEMAEVYDSLHVRDEVIGAGLSFRNYSSERLMEDKNEVLIVRGVIANTTDKPRDIPLLRLALYNDQKLLQEKIINPPQQTLDVRGTVGFRITLPQPDANASRFEVTFTAPKAGSGK